RAPRGRGPGSRTASAARLDDEDGMRIITITLVVLFGAVHLWLGTWAISNTDQLVKLAKLLEDLGFGTFQDLDLPAWRWGLLAGARVNVIIGVSALVTGLAIAAEWRWATAAWLAVISFTALFYLLWAWADLQGGTLGADDVVLTAVIVAACAGSWL